MGLRIEPCGLRLDRYLDSEASLPRLIVEAAERQGEA